MEFYETKVSARLDEQEIDDENGVDDEEDWSTRWIVIMGYMKWEAGRVPWSLAQYNSALQSEFKKYQLTLLFLKGLHIYYGLVE